MLDIIFLPLFGLLLHQTKRISDHAPRGWTYIVNYCIGVVGILAVFPHAVRKFGASVDEARRAVIALAIVAMGIGSGVLGGWIVDTLFAAWRKKK